MILLYLTLCLVDVPECHEFEFEPDTPWTMSECVRQSPSVAAAAISQMNGAYTLRSMRCGVAGERDI